MSTGKMGVIIVSATDTEILQFHPVSIENHIYVILILLYYKDSYVLHFNRLSS